MWNKLCGEFFSCGTGFVFHFPRPQTDKGFFLARFIPVGLSTLENEPAKIPTGSVSGVGFR